MGKICIKCETTETSRWCGARCRKCYEAEDRLKNVEIYRARARKWAREHKAQVSITSKKWAKENRMRMNALAYAWAHANPDKVREARRRSQPARTAYQRVRHAAMAVPVWLSEEQNARIKQIYFDCPKGFHVDHIVPLKAKDPITREHIACGLHVPWNLQILPKALNLKKNCLLTIGGVS